MPSSTHQFYELQIQEGNWKFILSFGGVSTLKPNFLFIYCFGPKNKKHYREIAQYALTYITFWQWKKAQINVRKV